MYHVQNLNPEIDKYFLKPCNHPQVKNKDIHHVNHIYLSCGINHQLCIVFITNFSAEPARVVYVVRHLDSLGLKRKDWPGSRKLDFQSTFKMETHMAVISTISFVLVNKNIIKT